MKIGATAMVSALLLAPSQAADRFLNHGVASHAVESRGMATVHDRTGRDLVISLNNDPLTSVVRPERVGQGLQRLVG